MHNYLKTILMHKEKEVQQLKLKMMFSNTPRTHLQIFKRSLCGNNSIRVIAEIKRKSPSKNMLAAIDNPVQLARQYVKGGAAAISVLTDAYGFSGSMQNLADIAEHISLPILCKDFIIDPIQIEHAANNGANAVLLIVAILGSRLAEFIRYARLMGIDALVEVHTKSEIELALAADAEIIGINNRDLTTFEVDVENAINLKKYIPEHIVAVAESGIHNNELVNRYYKLGFNAVLIGEYLVKSAAPVDTLQQLLAAVT